MRVQAKGASEWVPEKPLVPGWYEAQVDGVEQKAARNSGNAMLSIRWKITGGPEQEDDRQTLDDRVVFDNLMLEYEGMTEKGVRFARDKLLKTIVSLGVNEGDEFDTDDMIGQVAEIYLKIEKDQNGQDRNAVNDIRPVGGFPEE